MNAAAFRRRVKTGPGPHPENWFNRKHGDCGTPIFDAMAAENEGAVEFMHSRIQVELEWPRFEEEEDHPRPSILSAETLEGIDEEGNISE